MSDIEWFQLRKRSADVLIASDVVGVDRVAIPSAWRVVNGAKLARWQWAPARESRRTG